MSDIAERYEVDAFGCHVWRGRLGDNGRPIVWRGRRPMSAHKLAYEAKHGSVPDGLVLDHRCRNVLCVNPVHLEPVTKAENELRKSAHYRLTRMRCPVGHALDEATRLTTPTGGCLCRWHDHPGSGRGTPK